jgi:WD40 repeat protein
MPAHSIYWPLALCVTTILSRSGFSQPPPAKVQPHAAEQTQARTDQYGDPLPEGAVARMGSLRFIHGFGHISRIILSPDEKLVASQGFSMDHRLWEANTGREVPLDQRLKKSYLISIFPVKDRLIAVEVNPGRVVLRDVPEGQELQTIKIDAEPQRVSISPDGQTLFWCVPGQQGDGSPALGFCNLSTGKLSKLVRVKSTPLAYSFRFSADGRTLAGQKDDQSIDVWDVPSATIKLSLPPSAAPNLGVLALSPDGTTLAVAAEKQSARLWNVRSGKELPSVNFSAKAEIYGLNFSPNGGAVAAYCPPYGVEVKEIASGNAIHRLFANEGFITSVAFFADGKRLAAGDGSSVTIWDLATDKPCHEFGHTNMIWRPAFSPDSRSLVTAAASRDTSIRVWDSRTGKQKNVWRSPRSGIKSVAFSPYGKLIGSAGVDGTARLWDATTGREVFRFEPNDGAIYAMAFSPDGKMLATGGRTHAVRLWDVATGRIMHSFGAPNSLIRFIAFAPDQKTLATVAMEEKVVRVWSLASSKEVWQFAGTRRIFDIAFAPDGRLLTTCGTDGTVIFVDAVTGKQVRQWSFPDENGQTIGLYSLVFSPDGRLLALGCFDSSVRLCEVATGLERARYLGHRNAVFGVAFSPDGRLVASGSADHTAVVWDVDGRATGPPVAGADEKTLRTWWEELGSTDREKAYPAYQKLMRSGKSTVDHFGKELAPTPAVNADRINRLVADLDNKEFAVRDKALIELTKLGDVTEPALRAALATSSSAELRRRAEALLEQLDPVKMPSYIRALRAVEILERLGTSDARKVLENLATGAPEVRLTKEAKASLERLAKRGPVAP